MAIVNIMNYKLCFERIRQIVTKLGDHSTGSPPLYFDHRVIKNHIQNINLAINILGG